MARTGRPSLVGKGRSTSAHKLVSITYARKAAILHYFETTACMQRVRSKFYFDLDDAAWASKRRHIYAWRKDQAKIKRLGTSATTANKLRVRPLGVGTTLTEDVELELVQWATDLRKDGVPVARLLLTTKAQELARDAGLKNSQFKASHSWTSSFLKRHRLAFRARSRCGNASDADGQAAAIKFGQDVADIIISKGASHVLMVLYNRRV